MDGIICKKDHEVAENYERTTSRPIIAAATNINRDERLKLKVAALAEPVGLDVEPVPVAVPECVCDFAVLAAEEPAAANSLMYEIS